MKRREFLWLGSAFAAGCSPFGRGFPAITSVRSPNGLLRHASVGTGNMAWNDIASFRTHPKIEMAAFCDVDSRYLDRVRKEFPKARFYRDWREMLEREGEGIDSLNASVPDHHHAEIAAAALKAGKCAYVQKPLCKTHAECAALRELAAESGRVTQLGAQYTAYLSDRQTVEAIRERLLGPVERVHLFSTRRGLSRERRHLPPAETPPEYLDWNLWLGRAKFRPYAPKAYHPLLWRIWRDLGSGWIGDIGCHLMSAIWLGMDLRDARPLSVDAKTVTDADAGIRHLVWPTATRLTWHFPGVSASAMQPFDVEWYDGCSERGCESPAEFLPPPEIDALFADTAYGRRPFEGKAVKCRDGWILQPHGSASAYLRRNDGTRVKPPKLPKVPTHYHEFVNACLEGRRASADFAWSSHMMDAILDAENRISRDA